MQKDQRNGENGVDEDRRGRAGRRMLNNSALLWTVTRQYGQHTTTLVCKAAGLIRACNVRLSLVLCTLLRMSFGKPDFRKV